MKVLQKIAILLLIPLMLFSSIGFSIDMHFCGDEIKSISFFGAAEPCEMANLDSEEIQTLPPCHQKKLFIADNKNKDGNIHSMCCHNETLSYEANQEVEETDTFLNQSEIQLVATAIVLFDLNLLFECEPQIPFGLYDPPLIRQDFSVLYQSFLI